MLEQLEAMVPHTVPPPTHNPGRNANPTGTGEGVGYIRGREKWAQCDGTHEYTLPAHMQKWGLSHAP